MTAPTEPATVTDAVATVRTLFFLRGIFAVVFGIVALVWPGITVWALVVAFGVYTLADGVVLVFQSVAHHRETRGWGWLALSGLVSVGIGVIALLWPTITLVALLYVIAFYAIVFGLLGVIAAIGQPASENRGLSIVAGVLAVILGVVLLAFPKSSILTLTIFLGVWAILFGILLMVLGSRIGKLADLFGGR